MRSGIFLYLSRFYFICLILLPPPCPPLQPPLPSSLYRTHTPYCTKALRNGKGHSSGRPHWPQLRCALCPSLESLKADSSSASVWSWVQEPCTQAPETSAFGCSVHPVSLSSPRGPPSPRRCFAGVGSWLPCLSVPS